MVRTYCWNTNDKSRTTAIIQRRCTFWRSEAAPLETRGKQRRNTMLIIANHLDHSSVIVPFSNGSDRQQMQQRTLVFPFSCPTMLGNTDAVK